MAYNRATAPVYCKGTMDVWIHNPITGDLDYYTNKVQTDQFTTNVNMAPIQAGIGNPTVINIPDSSEVNLTITDAVMSLEARALSTGGTLSYNGIVPVMESITADGTTLTVRNSPVKGYGMADVYAFIDNSGTAYTIDTVTNSIVGFAATPGESYCVRYFTRMASAQELRLSTLFAPAVEVVTIRLPAYSAQGSTANQGSRVGDFWIWIPRMQFTGKADFEGSQTSPATTDISGSALSYDEGVASGYCAESAATSLAYMVYMPNAIATILVEGLVVVGGEISVVEGGSVQVPVKYVINGQLVQPNYGDLSYESSSDETATVDSTGVVEGVAAGTCEITAELPTPALSVVCNCTVTAASNGG